MDSGSFDNPTPQFGTAEYVGDPGGDHCQFCHQPIAGVYHRLNGAIACPGCAEKMRGELAKGTHAAYVRALVFGTGAAIVGMILYAVFEIATGVIIGYLSLAVGWMVGTAMMKGSGGVGGRRYQIAAALLTYAAVSTAAIPVWIHYARDHQRQIQAQQQKLAGEQQQMESEFGQKPKLPQRPQIRLGAVLGGLLLLGLASPFMELMASPWGGLIGLLILFVGIRIALRITAGRPAEVYGPFSDTPRPAR